MDAKHAWALRRAMVDEQIAARDVEDEAVLSAMRTVPRDLFMPEAVVEQAYLDRPVPIYTSPEGQVQTVSQPYIVAFMTEALQVGPGDRVLEVGTGSGYQAAVLAEVVSEVYTIDVVAELAEAARERLARLHYRNVQVRHGDGALGWPEAAPFDGILVACGAPEVPRALLDQLAPGRRMIVPVGAPDAVMKLQVWEKGLDGALSSTDVMSVRFVPLVSPTKA